MKHVSSCYIILLFFFMSGCLPKGTVQKTSFEEGGEVFIYLQPLPQEAFRIRFIIEGISAIHDDGRDIPLTHLLNEVKVVELTGQQKLLASGPLTSGSYQGISIRIKKAFLQGEEGESELFVPDEPVSVEYQYKVERKKAQILFLSLQASGTITNQVLFTPLFSITPPVKGLASLTGYVSNADSNVISVFDKRSMQVLDIITTGNRPTDLVLDKRRGRGYVAASGDDTIEVMDMVKREIVDRIRLNYQDEPVDLVLIPGGRTLVSVNRSSNTVSIIDTLSLSEIRRVRVGERPTSAVVGPSGTKAFIMNSLSNSISVVDLTQQVLSVTFSVERTPLRGAFNLAGDRLFVINRDSPDLLVIDPSRLTVTEKVFVGMDSTFIEVDRKSGLLFVGKMSGGEIAIIDPFSSMLIDSIRVRGNAAFMTIDDEENNLFVTFPNIERVQKINLTSKKIMAEIEVGEGAYAVAVMGER